MSFVRNTVFISAKRFDVALILGCVYKKVIKKAKHIKPHLSTKRPEEQSQLSLTCQHQSFYTSESRNSLAP